MISVSKILFISMILLAVVLEVPHAVTSPTCGLIPGAAAVAISANEPWYCPINNQIYSQWAAYLPAAMVVVFLSFLIAAIIFMVGVALNSNRIRNFGVGELYEAVATTIIVAAFLYLCAVVFGILPGVLVGNINPYATTFNLMSTTIKIAQQMYGAIFNVYVAISYSTTPVISLEIGGAASGLTNILTQIPQLAVNVYAIGATIFFLDPALAITRFLVDGIVGLYAEYYLMIFFSVASIPVFLIPGVFFRAIFPTRALGGILIALAFGFYLIMPSLFAVSYYFTAPTIQRDMSVATLQIERLGVNAQDAATASSPLAQQLSDVKSSLNGFWLMIFFYPGLIIAITYTAVQEISNFIGRASRVGGLMRRFV